MLRLLLIGCMMLTVSKSLCQQYFKQLRELDLSSQQRILRFSNGDVLIGDSAFEGSLQGEDASISLTRIDQCGAVVWSHRYHKTNLQLHLIDFILNAEEEILTYGTASDGLKAALFILKVQSDGNESQFRLYSSTTPSHAAYSIDVHEDEILAFGSILVTGAPRTGFLAVLDADLNVEWSKQIVPFTFEGRARFTSTGDIMARSEALHYMFDNKGNLMWAQSFDRRLEPVPMGGPFEVDNGHVFEAFDGNEAFFYKLDQVGRLVWQSPLFPSTAHPAQVHQLPDRTLIFHHSVSTGETNSLSQGLLTPAGEISERLVLQGNQQLHIGSVFHSIRDGIVDVVGNRDAQNAQSNDRTAFLMKFPVSTVELVGCYSWQTASTSSGNRKVVTFPRMDVDIDNLALESSAPGGIMQSDNADPYHDICSSTLEYTVVSADTLLSCNQKWLVSLSSKEFRWDDGFPNQVRVIDQPIVYRARNNDCSNPIIQEFCLRYDGCDCSLAIPNAFTPNGDGVNDFVEALSVCAVLDIQTSIFDRWGNLVGVSDGSQRLWDGRINGSLAPPGFYLTVVQYELQASQGGTKKGIESQGVLLIR